MANYIHIHHIYQKVNVEESAFARFNMRAFEFDTHRFTISNLSTVTRVGIADETGIVVVDITRSCNLYLKHDQSDCFHLNIMVIDEHITKELKNAANIEIIKIIYISIFLSPI